MGFNQMEACLGLANPAPMGPCQLQIVHACAYVKFTNKALKVIDIVCVCNMCIGRVPAGLRMCVGSEDNIVHLVLSFYRLHGF